MQQLVILPCRRSAFRFQRILVQHASYSSQTARMGLPFALDESQAREKFDQWRKSFWLAPGDWQKTPVTITPRYLPCWSFSFKGSASAEAYVKRGSWLGGGVEWQRLADRVLLPNMNLTDINVYAAHTYDRQLILELDMKVNHSLEPLNSSSMSEDTIEEWTVDRDTAFEIGWDLTVVNTIQNLCVKQLNQKKRGEYRITSLRFPIDRETQELIYFPVYIVDYQYRNRPWQCLINGRTGYVAGIRQFSQLKVMAAMMGLAYPVALVSSVSVVSFAVYSFSGRVVLIPCALLATGLTFPLITLAATQIAKYIRDYSHLYRGKRDIREWLDFKKQNPYIFNDKSYDAREDAPGAEREQTRKSTYSFNIGPDLYGILGVSRVATSATIKQAYLIKVKEFHPDRNVGNKQVEETFKLINQAYTILSDPEQRQLFDEYGYDHVKYK